MPKLYHDGMMVIGDSASMVDVKRLKGIHLGMKAGMLAAETALQAIVSGDFSSATLASYEARVENSYIRRELWKTRNFHQTISKGMFASMPLLGFQEITGGRGILGSVMKIEHKDYEDDGIGFSMRGGPSSVGKKKAKHPAEAGWGFVFR